MNGYYMGTAGYYEGDIKHGDDILVPQRSTPYHTWVNNGWVFSRDKWLTEIIRPERNKLLLESDFTQLADAPISLEKKSEWAKYRQDLRDITETADYDNFKWPVKP